MSELMVGRTALLVVDMQHDFVDRDSGNYNPGAEDAVARTVPVVAAMREAGLPVIWTIEAHRPSGIDGGLENYAPDWNFARHTVEGTRGIEIVPELAPGPDDVV